MSSSEEKATTLSEADARAAINRWSGEGMFRIPHLGDKIFVNEIVSRPAYTIRLKTHREERKVRRRSVPYAGGPVDNFGQPPRPWDINARRPQPFQEFEEVHPLPHTERIEACSPCHGAGRVTCTTCQGKGQTPCQQCSGKGFRERTVMETSHDKQGALTTSNRMVQDKCTCNFGQVQCTGGCVGKGTKPCVTCNSQGRVKSFDELVVKFANSEKFEIADKTPVPDDWFGSLSGAEVLNNQEPRIDAVAMISTTVDEAVRDMLHESHGVDERETRILLQKLRIERVPVAEVRYSYAGAAKTLWICGEERKVHAPDAPWRSGRLWGVLGGVALGVLVLIAIIAMIVSR